MSDVEVYSDRLRRAALRAGEQGLDALLITPGPDLRYLVGYDAVPLERITCLVLPAAGDPVLLVPRLELLAAQVSPVGGLGIEIRTWDESDDPYRALGDHLCSAGSVALDDQMPAAKVLALRAAMPAADQRLAGSVIDPLRMRKDAAEIVALREAAEAIDRVHAAVPGFLRAGRTEAQIGADIADAILAEGHTTVDFVIVASGPNGASPHHAVSDRVVQVGDAVTVDIGGEMPSGYRSDCTRTYAVGDPGAEFLDAYGALLDAQSLAVHHVRPGVTAESIDRVARGRLDASDLAEYFIHRTGHGIGLQTHEEPYIREGSDLVIEPGMAFSVEPGFYVPGRHGARIEDIVVCTDTGVVSLNQRPRTLVVVES